MKLLLIKKIKFFICISYILFFIFFSYCDRMGLDIKFRCNLILEFLLKYIDDNFRKWMSVSKVVDDIYKEKDFLIEK